MTESMILQLGNIKFLHKPFIVVSVRAWLCWTLVIGKDIIVIVNYFFKGFNIPSNSLFIGISRQEFFVFGVLTTNSVCFLSPSMR